METLEINHQKINEYAAKSAHTYLEYLNQNERIKGVIRVDVLKCTKTNEKYEYIFKLSRKIREDCIDYVIFEIDDIIYETNDIRITYYDEDTRLLTVKIVGEFLQKHFSENKVEKIVVISDLKFLVRRVENWYICNEKNFSIPEETHSIVPDETLYHPSLSPSHEQKRAINQILYGNPWAKPNECYDQKAFTYIWGPPGTGKTQVVLAYSVLNYLNYLKQHPEQKILLTAPTNVALDQMLFSLIDVLERSGIEPYGLICRVGIPTKNFKEKYPYLCHRDKEFENRLLKNLNRIKLQIDHIQKELQESIHKLAQEDTTQTPIEENPLLLEIDQKREEIKKLRKDEQSCKAQLENENELIRDTYAIPIIACTLDGYIAHNLEQAFSYAHIFLDEAGYASLIKAGTLFVNDCPITFLGDHKQLNPICEMSKKITNDSDSETVVLWEQSSLYISDFLACNHRKIMEKYTNRTDYDDTSITDYNELATIFLSKTFRFGSSLSKILDHYVYKNGFESANQEITTNLYYIHAPLTTEREQKRDNIAEANAIKRFLSSYPNNADVGILTAYTDQIKCLTKELSDSPIIKDQPDKIFTVHATQGHEWDTVILSVSDTDTAEKFFTDTVRKDSGGVYVINTAVSRAKRNLILVCDYNYWNKQENQMLTELLKISKKITADHPETYPEIKTVSHLENTEKTNSSKEIHHDAQSLTDDEVLETFGLPSTKKETELLERLKRDNYNLTDFSSEEIGYIAIIFKQLMSNPSERSDDLKAVCTFIKRLQKQEEEKNKQSLKETFQKIWTAILYTAVAALFLFGIYSGLTGKNDKKQEIQKPSTDVYITVNGKKYHDFGCETILNSSTKTVTQKEAEAMGRKPCTLCNPDKIIEMEMEIYNEIINNQEGPAPKYPYY